MPSLFYMLGDSGGSTLFVFDSLTVTVEELEELAVIVQEQEEISVSVLESAP